MRKREIIRIERRKEKRRKKGFPRKLPIGIAIAIFILLGGLVSWFLLTEKEVSFEEALKQPQLRESYIERIVEQVGKPDYVAVVNYVDTPEEVKSLIEEYNYIFNPDHLMAAHSPKIRADLLGKQSFPVRVSVFPFAFSGEIIKTETDFISCLLHEYFHAENAQKGKTDSFEIFSSFLRIDGQWNKDLFLDVDEMNAIRMELATQTKISQEYRVNRMGRYLDYYTNIWNHSEGMEPEFIKTLKIEFFEPWIVNVPGFFKKWQDGKEIWYLKHPETGRVYYLPEEIIWRFQNGKG